MPNMHQQIRMAQKLDQALEPHRAKPANTLQSAVSEIQQYSRMLKASFKQFRLAREHGWSTALAGVENVILIRVRELYEAASRALNETRSTARYPKPTLRDLYGELQQLEQEFPSSKLELRAGTISVETSSIELEGVYLGSFHIKLSVSRLASRADFTVFEVEALDPNPAASNESVTHPHVQDGRVCCGDATVSIASALKQGRIVDAFLALNSVLHTYNSHSPYVSLDDWSGVRCADCDDLLDSDHQYTCESCGSTVCEDCSGWCEECQMTFCKNCLEQIDEPELKYCCRSCRESCDHCGRFFVTGDLKNGLCPTCLDEQHTQEQEISNEQPDPAIPTPSDPRGEAGACAVETAPA